jgi:hypothetical protein
LETVSTVQAVQPPVTLAQSDAVREALQVEISQLQTEVVKNSDHDHDGEMAPQLVQKKRKPNARIVLETRQTAASSRDSSPVTKKKAHQSPLLREPRSSNRRVIQLLHQLRELQAGPPPLRTLASVEALLAFSSYNLEFFNELCMELAIEMPAEILLKRRPTPLELRTAIAPLILALM